MPVENATYISDLNSDWPEGTEIRREGDDHLRLIKAVLQATFEAFKTSADSGVPVSIRQDEINSVVDRVLRAGDTMTGPLVGYQTDPGTNLEFVTKEWVENLYSGVNPGGGSSYAYGITDLSKSTEQTITKNSTLTLAHSLSRAPDNLILTLKCLSSDQGYSTDDLAFVWGPQSNDTANNAETGGISIAADADNFYLTVGANVWINAISGGGFAVIDVTKWSMIATGYLIG